jgi:hypothetical protein
MPEGGAATGTRVLGDVPVYERAHPVALLVGRGDKVSSKTCSLLSLAQVYPHPTHPPTTSLLPQLLDMAVAGSGWCAEVLSALASGPCGWAGALFEAVHPL